MVRESVDVSGELKDLRNQLTVVSRQLGELVSRHEELAALVSQALGPRRENKGAEPLPGPPGNEVLARCGQDILRVLREVGRPLTTLELLDELVNRHLSWRESVVRHTLAELIAQGLVQETGNQGTRKHSLVQESAPRA